MNDIIADKLKLLPENPGVYTMYDADGTVIYVGKAKVLKNRVRQYFHHGVKTEKVMAMVLKIIDFSYIITNTELDALALESNLIKKHKPQYNILLKDDKSRPYIKIDIDSKYPVIEITRKIKRDGARYFGPFIGVSVADLYEIVKVAFNISVCGKKVFSRSHRECLNYHIGLCSAPCTGKISPEDYRALFDKVIAYLTGKEDPVTEILTAKMESLAEKEMFEQAIMVRELIQKSDKLRSKIIMTLPRDTNADVIYYSCDGINSAAAVMVIRMGKTLGCDILPFKDANISEPEALSTFLAQYYDGTRVLPEEVVLQTELEFPSAIKEWMRSKYKRAAMITVPRQGVRAQLLDNARVNIEEHLAKSGDKFRREYDMTEGACSELKKALNLPVIPRRIECFDISNISGADKVASMAVFVGGAPERSSYRRFKIKTVEGADDFASINEAVYRRLLRLLDEKFGAHPDLIIIDGGKGQLSSALEAAERAGVQINFISIAKKREEIYIPNNYAPKLLPRSNLGLKLVQRIRDEAHRFAINYHRSLRSQKYLSELEKIPGVGKARLKALYGAFKSIDAAKSASAEELAAVKGIDTRTAQNIVKYFSHN